MKRMSKPQRGEPRKKTSYFPLNPCCLIGINGSLWSSHDCVGFHPLYTRSTTTWRIIPVSNPYLHAIKRPFGRGRITRSLGDVPTITMVTLPHIRCLGWSSGGLRFGSQVEVWDPSHIESWKWEVSIVENIETRQPIFKIQSSVPPIWQCQCRFSPTKYFENPFTGATSGSGRPTLLPAAPHLDVPNLDALDSRASKSTMHLSVKRKSPNLALLKIAKRMQPTMYLSMLQWSSSSK